MNKHLKRKIMLGVITPAHRFIKKNLYGLGLAFILMVSLACGSSGGASLASTSISGTGTGGTTSLSKVSGSIDQFGSVYVGGVHFVTDNLLPSVEGNVSVLTDLELGMWVTIEGNIDTTSLTGTATALSYESHHAGNITSVLAGNNFVINGVSVETDDLTRLSPGLTLPLSVNQRVKLSGQYLSSGNFYATHVGSHVQPWDRKKNPADLETKLGDVGFQVIQIEVESDLGNDTWRSNNLQFDFKDAKESTAGLVRPPRPKERVVVRGQKLPSGNFQVLSFVSRERDMQEQKVNGLIQALASAGSKPAVTIDSKVYNIEPFTQFEDESRWRLRRFGYKELAVGDRVVLEVSKEGFVIELKRVEP